MAEDPITAAGSTRRSPGSMDGVGTDDLGAESFSAAVEAVSSAFGDPTRRAIFLHLRSNPSETVTEIARAFDLHPNVVRHHLDRLVAGGHVRAEAPQRTTSVGRPAKRFSAVSSELTLELSSRRDDLLVALLEAALSELGPDRAEQMAEQVGHRYGHQLAEEMGPGEGPRSVHAAMTAVAQALSAHGYAARAEDEGTCTSIVVDACPFGEAASHHPVLCAVDRGMVAGLLEGLGASSTAVDLRSKARGDDACRATA